MADEEVRPKKGGNKIMIIGICVMMLITGGFVGLKIKAGGGDKNAQPTIKMGADILDVDEFLVNLQDDGTQNGKYLRTKISVQCVDSFKKEELDKYKACVQDAVIAVLSSNSVSEIQKANGRDVLKKRIAAAANDAIEKSQEDAANGKKEPPKPVSRTHHKDWDSDTGPILKVYFTSFAFQ